MIWLYRIPFGVTHDIVPLVAVLDGVPLVGLSAPALVGLAVVLLLTGRIVPRVQLRDKQAEADRWREAYESEREARALADKQSAEMLEGLRTNHAVIVAMFQTLQEMNASSGGST